jgi:glycogen phosphorylase
MTSSGAVPSEPVRQVAYFSMEIGLESAMPTYAGGLGVLAGDTVRAAADLGVPFVAISLLYQAGYFEQELEEDGTQKELPARWRVESHLEPVEGIRLKIRIEDRPVTLRAWRYRVSGFAGEVPVYFLDADLPENQTQDRELTGKLYGGDLRYRLAQEVILGIGGVQLLRALGHRTGLRLHLNEGHAALSIVALIEEELARRGWGAERAKEVVETVREMCVFTTHTPVPAGHDRFPPDIVREVVGEERHLLLKKLLGSALDMTELALLGSSFVNGVSLRHAEVSRNMFGGRPIRSVTNGVHVATWTAPPFQRLFDRYVPEWRRDTTLLHYALAIPTAEITAAHGEAKRALFTYIADESQLRFDPHVLTIGFARRATAYKRADLIMSDPGELMAIAREYGPLQLVFAGKAHPNDHPGKEIIRKLHKVARELREHVRFVYLEGHDMQLARVICSGVDIWLNTPRAPHEASGTSGMKAALNGVPNLSVRDGWWVEGHIEGVTGWAIGQDDLSSEAAPESDALDAASLYAKLADHVIPTFYRNPEGFAAIRRNAIARNGAFFNAQRMVWQYVELAYKLEGMTRSALGSAR